VIAWDQEVLRARRLERDQESRLLAGELELGARAAAVAHCAPRSGAGQAGSVECLALEQDRASPDAVTTRLGADRAVAMVLGVSIALLGTRGARTHTGDEQIADG